MINEAKFYQEAMDFDVKIHLLKSMEERVKRLKLVDKDKQPPEIRRAIESIKDWKERYMKCLESNEPEADRLSRICEAAEMDFEEAERWEYGLRGWTYDE